MEQPLYYYQVRNIKDHDDIVMDSRDDGNYNESYLDSPITDNEKISILSELSLSSRTYEVINRVDEDKMRQARHPYISHTITPWVE